MDEEEFKARTYEVMRHLFDVQQELGRLFHEKIYYVMSIRDKICRAKCGGRAKQRSGTKRMYIDAAAGVMRP